MKRRFKTREEFEVERNWPPTGWVYEMYDLAGQEIDETRLRDKGYGDIDYETGYSTGGTIIWSVYSDNIVNMENKTNNNFIIHPVNEFKF